MRIASVVRTRADAVKLAAVHRALDGRADVEHLVVHAGRPDAAELPATFFTALALPAPQRHLGVRPGSDAAETAGVMQRLEPALLEDWPDVVLVYGDGNAALAAALVGAKLGLRVGHIEAGLRSGAWTMPEEINRVVTDRLADLLFVPSRDALDNLKLEGVPPDRIHFVGNLTIDSLAWAVPRARKLDSAACHGVAGAPYAVVTLHRPVNVDVPATLRELVETLEFLSETVPVVFPVHPRTRAQLDRLGLTARRGADLRVIDLVGYVEMVGLVAAAALVVTDSSGLEEEATCLGVPCLTVRSNTERPVTCLHGTNRLVPPRRDVILAAARRALQRRSPALPMIERWDGRASERLCQVLCDHARFPADALPDVAPVPRPRRRALAIARPANAV